MCKSISTCIIEDYEWMKKTCRKSLSCVGGAVIFTGVSATCTAFGLIGIFKNYSPEQAYSILFIVGLLGDSIVIPTCITYLLGCALSKSYTLPTHALPHARTGAPKPRILLADSSSPIEVDSPIRNARGVSPQRKRSLSR
jgi:hypothetical protein